MTTYYNLYDNNINEVLLRESLSIPQGWHEEVYFNKESNSISFSSLMTSNNWTDANDKVGIIEAFDLSELEGWKNIDGDFYEVDDMCNEADPTFEYKEYERYYEDSSIVTKDEAIDRLTSFAEDDHWYEEIKDTISKIKGVEQ